MFCDYCNGEGFICDHCLAPESECECGKFKSVLCDACTGLGKTDEDDEDEDDDDYWDDDEDDDDWIDDLDLGD